MRCGLLWALSRLVEEFMVNRVCVIVLKITEKGCIFVVFKSPLLALDLSKNKGSVLNPPQPKNLVSSLVYM